MKKSVFVFTLASLLAALLSAGCGKHQSARAKEATLAELNRDLSVVMMKYDGRLPDTNEFMQFLASTGKTFPTPPPGKKIVLDPVARQFILQDQ